MNRVSLPAFFRAEDVAVGGKVLMSRLATSASILIASTATDSVG